LKNSFCEYLDSVATFIKRPLMQIRQGGSAVLFRKMRRVLLLYCFLNIIAVPVVLVMRLIRPLILFRIGVVDVGRIGGIYDGDWYLSEKADGQHQGRYFDFFYYDKSTTHVNKQWLKMWRCVLPSVPGNQLWQSVRRLNRLFPGYKKHEIPDHHVYPYRKEWQAHLADPTSGRINIYNKRLNFVLKNNIPNIAFTLGEKEMGRRALEDVGIPNKKQYICFHARDSAYLDAVYKQRDWSYHDYRDSSIQNYVPAADEMVNRGYYAVRMGARVKDSILCSNSKVIDYATNGKRTDFNDIYIGSHCHFFLCSDGGMSVIPEMFRIPCVYVNWTSILRISTWVLNGLFIFKKFYLRNKNRFMTFSEIMNLDFGGRETNDIFMALGLEVIENTPEEISAVTIEMDERLNRIWETTEEDEELQQKFWTLFGPNKLKSPDLRIGAEFLRGHRELLR
jgi:putative glycosyltransferase (TIGR04372 family)